MRDSRKLVRGSGVGGKRYSSEISESDSLLLSLSLESKDVSEMSEPESLLLSLSLESKDVSEISEPDSPLLSLLLVSEGAFRYVRFDDFKGTQNSGRFWSSSWAVLNVSLARGFGLGSR